MQLCIGTDFFDIRDALLTAIVRAIDKAVCEDVPSQLREMPLETNNYIALIRGDFINQNLRSFAVEEGGVLHGFQRYGWRGRLLISPESRLTFSITTESNLNTIPRKIRQRPHFTQSLLHQLNGNLHGRYEQTRLFDTSQFDKETYEDDFDEIANGAFAPEDGYHHCVVVYRAVGKELEDIKLVVLDPNFNVVTEESLVEYMKPDFARLTEQTASGVATREAHNDATHRLPTLKLGVKPGLREEEKEG